MALIIADRVKETTATQGTGSITLSGATFGGFQSFSDAVGEGNTTYYCIQNESNFEIGIGTYSSNTLSRDTVFQSSNSDSKISISGAAIVFCVVPADRLVFKDETNSVVFPTPFAFKRSDDGDYWQALSTDHTNRVASFFLEEGSDPTWKIGLKTTTSQTVAPYYAYISAKDGFIELRGNSSSILSVGDEDAQGLQVNHQLKNIIDIRKNGGEIAIQNLDLNSDETTKVKNNSVAYTVFEVESSVSHAADLQTWSVSTDEKASLNQYGEFQSVGSIISPSGRFNAVRFSDLTIQTTAGLPFSSGQLIDQNKVDIATVSGLLYDDSAISGYFESRVDNLDVDIVTVSGLLYNDASLSGYFESRVDSADISIVANSGYFESRVDTNAADIAAVSGLTGGGGGGSYDDTAISGYFESRVDSIDSDIATVSGLLYDDTAISGYFESRVDVADSSITANSGYFESRADAVDSNLSTVSGLLTPSGESFDFSANTLTYNNSDGGSFTADLSSLSTFDTSGVSLGYSAGTLTYTNNAGGTFGVDLSSISGDVYAMIVDGAPSTLDTLNEIAAALNDDENIATTLTSLISTTSGNLQSQIASNDTDIATNVTSINTVSGLLYDDSAVSGYFESRADSADSDIATVSGLLYSDASLSGYFENRVDSNETNITTNTASINTVSGLIPNNTFNITAGDGSNYTIDGMGLNSASDPTIYVQKGHTYKFNKTFSGHPFRVSTTDGGSVYSDADGNNIEIGSAAGSVTFEVPQDAPNTLYYYCTAHASNMKGLIYTTTESVDINGTPSGVSFFDQNGSISGDSSFTYDGSNVFVSGSINTNSIEVSDTLGVSGVSTLNAGVKTKLNTEVDGATITFDMDQSNTHSTTLGGNRTLAVSNVDAGQKFTLRIAQDSTGQREANWWSNINWIISSGSEPTLNSGVDEVDYFGFLCTSAGYYDGFHMTELSTGGGGGSSYDDAAISGYFESRVDSADSNITANSGYFESRVDTNADDIITVSGLTGGGGGGGTTHTAGSGLTLVGNEFNVYGGSGNFEKLEIKPTTTTNVGLTVQSAVSQSVNLQEWQNSSQTTLSHIDTSGVFNKIIGSSGTDVLRLQFGDKESNQTVTSNTDIKALWLDFEDGSEYTAGTVNGNALLIGTWYNTAKTISSRIKLTGTAFNVSLANSNKIDCQGTTTKFNTDVRPFSAMAHDLGSASIPWNNIYVSGVVASGVELASHVPANTTNTLYNEGGTLKFNGSAIGGGGSSLTAGSGITIDGADKINVYGGSGHFINLNVEGAFSATTKSFLIDHPTKRGMKLQYASLEGPENGVYVRGTSGSNIITLPEYWSTLVDQSTVTVTLTPIGFYQALYIEEKGKNYIKVGGSKGSYDYVVYGERKDVEKLKVEW